jgi:hypothetical protein
LLLSLGQPVLAQTYAFSVPELRMFVDIQPDSSVKIEYDITFENASYASPIDVVDIGTPHDDYDIGNFSANIDGNMLTDIRTSTYIDTGVEIHLEQYAIQPGETGTLHVEFSMPDMVYQDVTDRQYASLQITPTWFDGDSVLGSTNVQILIAMPEGVSPEAVRYQDVPFTQVATYEERTVVYWQWEDGSVAGPNRVGVSFPKEGMTDVIQMNLFQLTEKWLQDNPLARMIVFLLGLIGLSVLYFRFTGGTGLTLYFILLFATIVIFAVSPLASLFALPLLLALIVWNELTLKKRRKKYLPPIAQVEGGGIKRGLTAPEAATLLEMPLNQVLTLVVFGLLNKGILRQVEADPLTVEVVDAFQARDQSGLNTANKRAKYRRKAAQEAGTVIHNYEQPFIDFIEHAPGKPLKEIDFGKPMDFLIKQTAKKIENFDLSDTQDYYRRVIDRAWKQAESIGEIPKREKYLDNYLPWVMMDRRYPTVMSRGGYHYWPIWMRRHRSVPSLSNVGGRGGGSKSSGPSVGGKTSFGDVGASFAGWAENTMGGMAAAILPGSLQMPKASGGVIDLSGVDRVTGDVFEALAEASKSSGGGGGSSGGSSCACACAGCACACACAGGGR